MEILGSTLVPVIFLAILHMGPVFGFQQCPKGWTLKYDSCFKLFTEKKNWMDAKTNCESEGGDLVKIGCHNLQLFLAKNVIKDPKKNVWIGLNDRICEGSYYWTDNSKLRYQYWSGRNPNNGNVQNCVHIWSNRNFGWADGGCEYKMEYLCQRAPELYCN